ncbi:MAG TPA: patatin-like phospholipase family protein [Planctomycetota bacterium]|nr:patatin-like phospholipase family protein [Planctomycetota bacterium]
MNAPADLPPDRRLDHAPEAALACALVKPSRRGARRTALIVEGGGMRGAFAAGVATGLAEAGVPFDAFDGYFGSSAGALNLMYWLSRIPRVGTRVYVEDLTRVDSPRFLLFRSLPELWRRLAAARPVIDLHAVEHAMTVSRPVDREGIAHGRAPVWFPITRADDLVTEWRDARDLPAADLLPTLLAAASVPVLADVYDLAHGRYVDGACGAPLPVSEAIAAGYTDLVVVLNLPPPEGPAWYETLVLYALAGRRGLSSRVAEAVRNGRRARRAALRRLLRPPPGVRVTVLAPERRLIRSLERDPATVEACVESGVACGRRAVERARAWSESSGSDAPTATGDAA